MSLMHDGVELVVLRLAVLREDEDTGEFGKVSCAVSSVCGAGAV